MLGLVTTTAATRTSASMPKSWACRCWSPSACSHHLPAYLPNAGIGRHGENVKASRGHKAGSSSKRGLQEVKARCVLAGGHSPRDIWPTFTGSTRQAPGFTRRVPRRYLLCENAIELSDRALTGTWRQHVRWCPCRRRWRTVPRRASEGTAVYRAVVHEFTVKKVPTRPLTYRGGSGVRSVTTNAHHTS